MPNAYMPRALVHQLSEDLGETAVEQQAALTRLLKEQRRLTRWLEENAGQLEMGSGGVAVYLFGVVARMFDLCGGRLKKATWEQVREAEKRVGALASQVLPFDEGFPARVREISGKAQPHLLDEALLNLFERAPGENEEDLSHAEAGKVFFLLWVATDVLDQNWTPPKGMALDAEYTYLHIEPKDRKASDEG